MEHDFPLHKTAQYSIYSLFCQGFYRINQKPLIQGSLVYSICPISQLVYGLPDFQWVVARLLPLQDFVH